MGSAPSPETQKIRIASIPAEPWRNGGGVTRTIATCDGQWRISMAEIDCDGPYSRFDGLTRVSLVLRGAGIVLHSGSGVVKLKPFEAVEYDGAVAWQAKLIDGPVRVLNVMSANGRFRVGVQAITDELFVRPGGTAIVVALDSPCCFNGTHALETNHATIIDKVGHEFRVAPAMITDAPPVLVTIETLLTIPGN